MRRSYRASLAGAVAVVALCAFAAHAQTWVSLDGKPANTSAEISLDAAASSATQSVVDVYIHGFWQENALGSDGLTYQKITIPGLPNLEKLGEPNLPVARARLGIVTEARSANLTQTTRFSVHTYSNILVWPQPYRATDHQGWSDERFTKSTAIYNTNAPYPASDGSSDPPTADVSPYPSALVALHTLKTNPVARTLEVPEHIRFTVSHTGTPVTYAPMTRGAANMARAGLLNWPEVSPYMPVNMLSHKGEFLFIYESAYAEEIKPLVDSKKARGFHVTTQTIGATGNTCTSVHDIIRNWHTANGADLSSDYFALLIGDTSVIPLCTSPAGGIPTDDVYSLVLNPLVNFDSKVVRVGRLSVDNEADLANQVAKILAYENPPTGPGCPAWFDDALLIAHKENAPAKYQGCMEEVRTAFYETPPAFTTIYGSNAANDNSDIDAAIENGANVVCYRGHGDWNEWWSWDQTNQDFTNTDVAAVHNGRATPIVWSIACNTQDLTQNDCFGETWMEQAGKGAVAHYGATVPSDTEPNHALTKNLFSAVYRYGITTHADAINSAEHLMTFVHPTTYNAWMYLLLGDPEMTIRRTNPDCPELTIVKPLYLPAGCEIVDCCPGCPGPPIDIRVLDSATGLPVPCFKVAFVKFGNVSLAAPGGDEHAINAQVDEAQGNLYTMSDGWAHLTAPKLTSGYVVFTVTDSTGAAYVDSIQVTNQTAVGEPSMPASLEMHATPSVTSTWSHIMFAQTLAREAEVMVIDAGGRPVRTLAVRAGEQGVVWDGRDAHGARVPTGLYWAKVTGGALASAARIMMTR